MATWHVNESCAGWSKYVTRIYKTICRQPVHSEGDCSFLVFLLQRKDVYYFVSIWVFLSFPSVFLSLLSHFRSPSPRRRSRRYSTLFCLPCAAGTHAAQQRFSPGVISLWRGSAPFKRTSDMLHLYNYYIVIRTHYALCTMHCTGTDSVMEMVVLFTLQIHPL